jgi:hypothetical protein
MWCSDIISAASATSRRDSMVTSLVVIRSPTATVVGSSPAAMSETKSRSVTIPTGVPAVTTTTAEMAWSWSTAATSANVD